jgi:hypothetical protein
MCFGKGLNRNALMNLGERIEAHLTSIEKSPATHVKTLARGRIHQGARSLPSIGGHARPPSAKCVGGKSMEQIEGPHSRSRRLPLLPPSLSTQYTHTYTHAERCPERPSSTPLYRKDQRPPRACGLVVLRINTSCKTRRWTGRQRVQCC